MRDMSLTNAVCDWVHTRDSGLLRQAQDTAWQVEPGPTQEQSSEKQKEIESCMKSNFRPSAIILCPALVPPFDRSEPMRLTTPS